MQISLETDDLFLDLYLNKPQLFSNLIQANEDYEVIGRGGGKTELIIAPRVIHNVEIMPRGKGASVTPTLVKALSQLLPPMVASWEKLGFKRDLDFFIGKRPPKSWKWPTPYITPESFDYFISFFNGSGIHLVGQDRPGTSNGLSIDWLIGDEAKLLDKDKLEQELFQTLRGNIQHFGHLSEYRSMLFCTDMPTNPKAKWILDKREEMDVEQITLILAVWREIILSKSKSKINKLHTYLNELRKDCVYYAEYSSLENIHALGVDYFKKQKRILPDLIYQTSILSRRMFKTEGGFYNTFNSDIHAYDSYDYSYIESLDYNLDKLASLDCRQDADTIKTEPLDLAIDYNASINALVVAQEDNTKPHKEYKYVNSFGELGAKLSDTVQAFCDYYRHYPCRDINYYYDHTAVGSDAERIMSFSDTVIDVLRKNGWTINPIYLGQAPSHHSKFILWQYAFSGDHRLPRPRFNRTNCKYPILSLEGAKVKQGRNGFEKDKDDERNKTIPQNQTTHYSDAVDTLYFGKYHADLKEHKDFYEVIYY